MDSIEKECSELMMEAGYEFTTHKRPQEQSKEKENEGKGGKEKKEKEEEEEVLDDYGYGGYSYAS